MACSRDRKESGASAGEEAGDSGQALDGQGVEFVFYSSEKTE